MTVALGIASRMIVDAIDFSSSMRERASRSAGWPPGCRFASLCRRLSMARAAIPENPAAASRDSRLHLSDSKPGQDLFPYQCRRTAALRQKRPFGFLSTTGLFDQPVPESHQSGIGLRRDRVNRIVAVRNAQAVF